MRRSKIHRHPTRQSSRRLKSTKLSIFWSMSDGHSASNLPLTMIRHGNRTGNIIWTFIDFTRTAITQWWMIRVTLWLRLVLRLALIFPENCSRTVLIVEWSPFQIKQFIWKYSTEQPKSTLPVVSPLILLFGLLFWFCLVYKLLSVVLNLGWKNLENASLGRQKRAQRR